MVRSLFKGYYCNPLYLSLKNEKEISNIIIYDKSSVIPINFLNMNCSVYTGKELKNLFITADMVGFKFGNFVVTKKRCIYKLKKKKKNE